MSSKRNILGVCLVESVSSAEAISWSGGGVPQRSRRRRPRQRSLTPNINPQNIPSGK